MYKLGLNTGFAVNRYSNSESWTRLVNKCEVKSVQFTADLLNPSLPQEIINNQLKKINKNCKEYEIEITSTFTGAFTRLNHLAHPDKEIRKYWINWFKKFAEITIELQSTTMGSHFGILTTEDYSDQDIYEFRKNQNIENWHEIADYAKKIGIQKILWEPMSVGREYGETIEKCEILQTEINKNSPLPFKICLDVDHGDLSSENPDDTDPYKWLEKFANDSPVIHLKQSSNNKSGHWPFTDEYNKDGKIVPRKILDILKNKNIKDVDLILELSFKEREPWDSSIEKSLIESVQFWKNQL
jgi:D-erythrulose 1-phosphate 3-epimerase